MLQPKKTKYKKYHKAKAYGLASNTTSLKFGKYGVISLGSCLLTAKTLEAIRRTITKKFKRTGKIWIRVFPDTVVTRKPAEVRMGKGKGSPSFWVCRIKAGQILFEMTGISRHLVNQAVSLSNYKLGTKVAILD